MQGDISVFVCLSDAGDVLKAAGLGDVRFGRQRRSRSWLFHHLFPTRIRQTDVFGAARQPEHNKQSIVQYAHFIL